MNDRPFALHITWTCYGTWMPGDERGHVSNTLLAGGGFIPKQNIPGTRYAAGDSYTRSRAKQIQKWDTVRLTLVQAECVARSLIDCTQKRSWHILRAAIMPNHVHVVVAECPNDGPLVRRILKGNTQAALCDQLGHPARMWTAGGSDRYKNDQPAIDAAVEYVARQEGMLAGIDNMRLLIVENGVVKYVE